MCQLVSGLQVQRVGGIGKVPEESADMDGRCVTDWLGEFGGRLFHRYDFLGE